ncbi:MAG: class I SAM-dependent methyltransferase [Alphaproteobacteria bacterium]
MLHLDNIFHQNFLPQHISDGFFYQPRFLANSSSFTLLDSGDGKKLEYLAGNKFVRPERQALWQPADLTNWQDTTAEFNTSADTIDKSDTLHKKNNDDIGKWHITKNLPEKWSIEHFGLSFHAKLTAFRHYGFFPEQSLLWQEMIEFCHKFKQHKLTALNLFAYSGMASLLLANQQLSVVHVDASKKAILYAEENITHDKGVKLLIDDAMGFIKREIRRQNRYHIILLDPPKFGRGPKGEVWDIWQHLPELLSLLPNLLVDDQPAMVILTTYAIRSSCFAIGRALHQAMVGLNNKKNIHSVFGELCLTEQARQFYIPQSVYTICHIEPK